MGVILDVFRSPLGGHFGQFWHDFRPICATGNRQELALGPEPIPRQTLTTTIDGLPSSRLQVSLILWYMDTYGGV